MKITKVSVTRWMDKQNVVHVCCGVLFGHEEWYHVTCRKVCGTGDHDVIQNQLISECLTMHIFFSMWNLKNTQRKRERWVKI